ncbi:MAG: winged helix-turn-helix domain-containing protein [Dokdonella sp.]|uniref:winged helix-turn-helix domain-containing protein n=1 Tax=Dokdonella sp. TaxID=2291710 RepID=UPI003F7FA601
MTATGFEFGEYRFLPSARELWRGARHLTLPRRTFECIEHLIVHRDRAVGRDELVAAVFGRSNVSDAQLGQIVLRARRVVGDDGNVQHTIRTIAGYGYRWVAETREIETDTAGAEPAAIPSAPVPPSAAPRRKARLSFAIVIAAIAVVVIALACVLLLARRGATPSGTHGVAGGETLAVLPIQVDGLRDDAWVRLGAMDLVAERLRQAGLAVPPSENVLGLLATSASGRAEAGLRSATGARYLVRGRAHHDADGWRVELAAEPEHGIAIPVSFAAREAVDAARGAGDLLLAALGRRTPANARESDAALDETLQRARAAMLANELDTARAILGASPQLAARPAQLAWRLAQVDLRAGRLDRAEAALDQVLAQAATQGDAGLRADVLVARGSTRIRRGAFDDGGRDFDAALALLGERHALARGQALLGRANSRVAAHRSDEALADFGAARVDLEGAGDSLGVTRVDANLGMLELYRGRPAAALDYLPGAADRFQSFGALHELLLTLTGIIEAQLAMLQRDEAAATVERASALRERISDPDQRVDLLLNRAQVQSGAGGYREARAALQQAAAIATSGNRVLRARLDALEADLAARERRWDDAERAAAGALADWPASGADGDRNAVVRLRQRALFALDRAGEAQALLDRAREAPVTAAAEPGAVDDALAMAEWCIHRRDDGCAGAWLQHAAASADRRGVPAEIVAVAAVQGPFLLDAGERDAAVAVIGRVAPWAARDFDSALLQLRLFRRLGPREAWFNALRQAQALAGEREIAPALLAPPDTPATR